ncbi:hypothetical protein [Methylorubrum populi]|uniref:Uncharacterized protein n=1 Tax=Methylorubrum populi TaxID=223967 RepID=A0A833MZS2_9HYPH|nr:hypothetical protein [Methylorubrum populi]KAB7782880.1 hypothetical protein F8B43_4174 [Methylorubrum populi]
MSAGTNSPPIVSAYQGGRQILASGSMIVTAGAAPLVLTGDGDLLAIHFDIEKPFTRDNGLVVGGRYDEHSIEPEETRTAPLGSLTVTYTLHPYRPDVVAPDGAGRWGPCMFLLLWEVTRDAPVMDVPARGRLDYGITTRDPSNLFG